jgi:acyl-CoA thioesterase-1
MTRWAPMQNAIHTCVVPLELIRFERPLVHVRMSIAQNGITKIVAIGSSSTKGDGASSSAASYPSRLAAELEVRLPNQRITLFNNGEGGQEAPDEVARFKSDVVALEPTLVIWQVGTNAVWKDYDLDEVDAAINRGLERLRKLDADVILMDLQYAPAVLTEDKRPNAERMVEMIARAAEKAKVNVFRRFALMQHWNVNDAIPFDQMISNFDGNELHQNDWSYGCLARALSEAITEAAGPTLGPDRAPSC